MDRAHPPQAPSRRTSLARVALLAAGALACAPAPPHNLLIVVSDTLRADALSCYGGSARTPHICGLAESGVLFENAYSNGSWTLPSTVALFTGQYPGVFAREAEALEDRNDFYYVVEEEALLAERLRERGYDAVAFVESTMAQKPNALQGFDVVDPSTGVEVRSDVAERLAVDLSDGRYRWLLPALAYLEEIGARPFFALHWIRDPHAVYAPPVRLVRGMPLDPRRLPHPLEYYAKLAHGEHEEHGWLDLNRLAPELSPYEIEVLRALYHKEVESVDERVGHLLDALERFGLRERTYVLFTSDHGEGFGEHGKFLHADRWYYQEFVHVPLLLAGPGLPAGRRVRAAVSHVDVMPTLAELLGVGWPADSHGTSLRALWGGGDGAGAPRPQLLEGRSRDHAALIEGRFKLIRKPGADELYDLAADPEERRDLAAERPDVVASLAARFEALRAESAARRRARLDRADGPTLERTHRETREALEALGYVEP